MNFELLGNTIQETHSTLQQSALRFVNKHLTTLQFSTDKLHDSESQMFTIVPTQSAQFNVSKTHSRITNNK